MKEEQLRELLDSLSLEEKIGQLVQVSGDLLKADGKDLGPRQELGLTEEDVRNAGSTLNVVGAAQTRAVQEAYLKHSRHKIPLLFMADIIYGFRTVFPIPLALGCSFDPALVEKLCEATAKEAVASGVHLTFSPMVDLVRDGRWGRCMESTGEDPYLNACYARSFVKGFQKGLDAKGPEGPKGIASCVKHFAAYGAPEGGREYNTVDMSQRRLRQEYLPSYRAGVEEGCEMIMTSFNTVDGVPSTGNKWLMNDVLREEWGFEGVVITDYAAIAELIAHGVAEDQAEASRKAMEAGVDIDMCTGCYATSLKKLIEEGALSREQLDRAVYRVLKLKNKLGLFEDPFRGSAEADEKALFGCEQHRKLARKAAADSMVLLKNEDSLLPLSRDTKTALVGPYADRADALGMWAIYGRKEDVVTMKTGMEEAASPGRVESAPGCQVLSGPEEYGDLPFVLKARGEALWSEEKRTAEEEKALALAAGAQVTVAALGEDICQSGEGGSRCNIGLPAGQLAFLRKLRKAANKLVVVVFSGRPLELTEAAGMADAVLQVWYPGVEGGHAAADILYGAVNPSGRLSMSMPYHVGQLPIYYNHYNTGRPYDGGTGNRFISKYTDCPNDPLYPFGFGLSYHTATYGDIVLSADTMRRGETLKASVEVTNDGAVAGTETVQLYIRDMAASVARPVKELKSVRKVELQPGESRTVEFTITEDMLKFYNIDLAYVAEPGQFTVMAGPDCMRVKEAVFRLAAE